MMWWDGGWSWWGWLLLTVGMLMFWALVVWAAVVVAKSRSHGPRSDGDSRPSGLPERILAERYARGEMDAVEYRDRLNTLRSEQTNAA